MTQHKLSISDISHKTTTRGAKGTASILGIGRIVTIHFSHTAAIVVIAMSLGACSDNGRTAPTPENIAPIEDVARRDAQRVMSAPDARECEGILIDIRAKEYALRSRGYKHSADIYINSVRAALDTAALDAE